MSIENSSGPSIINRIINNRPILGIIIGCIIIIGGISIASAAEPTQQQPVAGCFELSTPSTFDTPFQSDSGFDFTFSETFGFPSEFGFRFASAFDTPFRSDSSFDFTFSETSALAS